MFYALRLASLIHRAPYSPFGLRFRLGFRADSRNRHAFDILEAQRPPGAVLDAGGKPSGELPRGAEVAESGLSGFRRNEERPVGAGVLASSAADAGFGIRAHDSVSPLVQSAGRTGRDAGRIVAVLTEYGDEALALGRTGDRGAAAILLHSDKREAGSESVLQGAGDFAGTAAPASIEIHDYRQKRLIGHRSLSLFRSAGPASARCRSRRRIYPSPGRS